MEVLVQGRQQQCRWSWRRENHVQQVDGCVSERGDGSGPDCSFRCSMRSLQGQPHHLLITLHGHVYEVPDFFSLTIEQYISGVEKPTCSRRGVQDGESIRPCRMNTHHKKVIPSIKSRRINTFLAHDFMYDSTV